MAVNKIAGRFMSKDDYRAAGARHQRDAQDQPTHYKRTDSSWQARAFWEGADAEKARLAKLLRHAEVPVDGRSPFIYANGAKERLLTWPPAAAEHLKRLALDFNAEKLGQRRARLLRAIGRMQDRYGQLTS